MSFKAKYIKEAVASILKIDPSQNEDDVEKFIINNMKHHLSNPTIIMDNNVTHENIKTNLVDLCHWIDEKVPVVSGNATFYVQPEVLQSPTSNMLRSLKKSRKSIKSEMFKYKPSDDKYQMLDLDQSNVKVIMNAEYGGSGAPTAAFYTKYSPAATTMMAQSIITIMAAFFEGYIGDNMKFFHINECMDWMNIICKKDKKIPNWVIVPTKEETKHRIRSHFFMYNTNDNIVIDSYINNCTDDELIYIFYANNLQILIERHSKIQKLISAVLSKLPLYEASEDGIPEAFKDKFEERDKYNDWVAKEMYMDPYTVPDVIKDDIKDLVDLVTQLCYIDYLTPDSIIKLNNHYRNSVLLVDTDSNVLYANKFIEFILDTIFPGESFNRSRIYNEMICVNILAAILNEPVSVILNTYGLKHNANKEARKELTMKNEFLFRRFLLMNKKKRYASSIVLREGHIIVPYKTEIKGLDFIKAGVTDEVTKKFTKMLEKNILFSDELQLHQLMRELKLFEKEIYHDLKSGGARYLKPQSYKSEGAYKNPWSVQTFKAVAVWNAMYPDNKIYSLDKVKMIKLIVTGVQDLNVIKDKFPVEYKLLLDNVFNSPNPELAKVGMKVIAIPSVAKETPPWVRELIDYHLIISDVCSSFRSVLDAFQIENIPIKTPNGKVNMTTSLISI